MERSLSALLPVCDVQSTLSATVLDLLDVLPDLTSRFEIVIVDDCSADATIEVADELAGYYPQVVALRHAARQGRGAAIVTGLDRSHGEVLFLPDTQCTVAFDEIHRLWRQISEHEVVLGRANRPESWRGKEARATNPQKQDGFCMFHRRALESIQFHLADQCDLRNYLEANRLQWYEVEVRQRVFRPPHRQRQPERSAKSVRSESTHGRPTTADASRLRRPNYLERIRQFAWGE